MLLLYILWDDWPISMISGSNEQHQFLSGIWDSRKAGSLWGMMRGVGGVRKSIHQVWLTKGLGLRLLCWGMETYLQILVYCEVGWDSRIHRLHLWKGVKPCSECPGFETKQPWWGSSNAGAWGNVEYPFTSIAPKFFLARLIAPDGLLSVRQIEPFVIWTVCKQMADVYMKNKWHKAIH